MYCNKCGKEIDDDSAFCIFCGSSVMDTEQSRLCSHCGRENSSDDAFCVFCGAPLKETYYPPCAEQVPPSGAQQPKNKTKTIVIVVVAVILALTLLGIGLGGFFIIQKISSMQEQPQQKTAKVENTINTEGNQSDKTDAKSTNNKATKKESTVTQQTQPAYSGSNQYIRANSDKDYIFSDSNARHLSSAEISSLSQQQCMIARNEIAARHGRLFNNSELQEYFDSKAWYKGTMSSEDYDASADSLLNAYEEENSANILEYEKSKGWK